MYQDHNSLSLYHVSQLGFLHQVCHFNVFHLSSTKPLILSLSHVSQSEFHSQVFHFNMLSYSFIYQIHNALSHVSHSGFLHQVCHVVVLPHSHLSKSILSLSLSSSLALLSPVRFSALDYPKFLHFDQTSFFNSSAKNKKSEKGKKIINGSSESPASDSDPKIEETFSDGEKIKQTSFQAGSSSNGRSTVKQTSGSEIEDFHSARISLSNISISKSGSKNSTFLEDQPILRSSQEPIRREEFLREPVVTRDHKKDHSAREVVRSFQDRSSFDYGSEMTGLDRRSMTEIFKYSHRDNFSPGSSSGYSASSKKNRQHLKRHCRPILGGSPFVICNNCLQILQLPMDFLTSRGRPQKLRCGSCSCVLIFSVLNGGHIEEDPSFFSDENNNMKKIGRTGFSLHHLMGYPSARDVMYLAGEEDDGSVDFWGSHHSQHFTSRVNSPPENDEDERDVRSVDRF